MIPWTIPCRITTSTIVTVLAEDEEEAKRKLSETDWVEECFLEYLSVEATAEPKAEE